MTGRIHDTTDKLWFDTRLDSSDSPGTLRQAAAVVPVEFVPGSAEAHERTIPKLSAEMFAAPIPVAAAVGGQAHCREAGSKG